MRDEALAPGGDDPDAPDIAAAAAAGSLRKGTLEAIAAASGAARSTGRVNLIKRK